ncbi:hypothetical protein GCM10027053_38540 [Intrasporangium mesophilum]
MPGASVFSATDESRDIDRIAIHGCMPKARASFLSSIKLPGTDSDSRSARQGRPEPDQLSSSAARMGQVRSGGRLGQQRQEQAGLRLTLGRQLLPAAGGHR